MNIEIANRLQQLRKEKGYSQEELAEKLGISRQAVSKWERAESSPDTDNLIVLAKLYNISLDELLNSNESIDEIKQRTKDINEIKEGITLTDDDGSSVIINNDGIYKCDKDGNKEKIKLKLKHPIKDALQAVFTLLIVIAYLLFGSIYGNWHPLWIIFLYIPVINSILDAIVKKRITEFCYPVLATIIFLVLGFDFGLWYICWISFVTIPLFYAIFNPIDKYVLKTKNDDEDD